MLLTLGLTCGSTATTQLTAASGAASITQVVYDPTIDDSSLLLPAFPRQLVPQFDQKFSVDDPSVNYPPIDGPPIECTNSVTPSECLCVEDPTIDDPTIDNITPVLVDKEGHFALTVAGRV